MDLFGFFYTQPPSLPAPFVEDTVFSPWSVCVSGFFIKNHVSVDVGIYVWVFNSIPLMNTTVFGPIPCSFYYCSSVVQLEIGGVVPSAVFLFCFVCNSEFFLAILSFLCFHIEMKDVLSRFVKTTVVILMGIALNL